MKRTFMEMKYNILTVSGTKLKCKEWYDYGVNVKYLLVYIKQVWIKITEERDRFLRNFKWMIKVLWEKE